MRAYLNLMDRVLMAGKSHRSRAGATRRVWGETLHCDMSAGKFPLITSRVMHPRPVLGELAAFLEGTRSTERFEKLGCRYWTPNAKAWREPGNDVGKIYGHQWRNWDGYHDQIGALVDGIVHDPHSRRHILTAWNPSDLNEMCLPPCHVLSQYSVDDEYLNCAVYMRSVDVCLGLPSDMVLYAALLIVLCASTGTKPGRLVFFFGDCHIYENHVEQAKKQVEIVPGTLPTWTLDLSGTTNFFKPQHLTIVDYNPVGGPFQYTLNV